MVKPRQLTRLHQLATYKTSREKAGSYTRLEALKRFLSIFNALIFDSKVDRGIPSLAAAPEGPKTRPRHSCKAASIIFFSCARSVRESSVWFSCSVRNACCGNQLLSIEKISVSQSISDRSMTFCNSRIFPGQGYD